MGLLDQAAAGVMLEEAERVRKHHAQIRKELAEQEAKVDAVFAKYNDAAGKLSTHWLTHREMTMFGEKVVYTFPKPDPNRKGSEASYLTFQILLAAKDAAYLEWQKEANKHGRFIIAAEKLMSVPPPGVA